MARHKPPNILVDHQNERGVHSFRDEANNQKGFKSISLAMKPQLNPRYYTKSTTTRTDFVKKECNIDLGSQFLQTTGNFFNHDDKNMGIVLDDLDGLSVRIKREIILKRATELINQKNMKFKFLNRGNNHNSNNVGRKLNLKL